MISNNLYGYKAPNTTYSAAELLAKQVASANKWKMEKMEGDIDPNSFAAKLKRADEYVESGEHNGATDSIGIILRQMDEPTPGKPVTKDVWHNGAHVSITRDALYGNTITIGGSANPDWISVSTSVGTVKIDLNDTTSLMKCLDMFSPEDINLIMKKIMEVKQAREALSEIDRMQDELMKNDSKKEENGDSDGEQSVSEAVGVVSAEEMRKLEGTREKKFVG
ncbi:MAG: hypothetical protein HDR07_10225 [Lachnospiraceae bacterium]|nr:hypothetical protein [Lachnospiraceae bacterium]